MKLLKHLKDGGPLSRVHGWFLIEWKPVFSIVLLHFKHGSREAYHSHAFHCISWVLWGKLTEYREVPGELGVRVTTFRPSLIPVITTRSNFHKVVSQGNTWVISFRGPWAKAWKERREDGETVTLTHGRKVVA